MRQIIIPVCLLFSSYFSLYPMEMDKKNITFHDITTVNCHLKVEEMVKKDEKRADSMQNRINTLIAKIIMESNNLIFKYWEKTTLLHQKKLQSLKKPNTQNNHSVTKSTNNKVSGPKKVDAHLSNLSSIKEAMHKNMDQQLNLIYYSMQTQVIKTEIQNLAISLTLYKQKKEELRTKQEIEEIVDTSITLKKEFINLEEKIDAITQKGKSA